MSRSKLTIEDVCEMRRRAHSGEATTDIAEDFGVSSNTALLAITGRSWGWMDKVPPMKNTSKNIKRRRPQAFTESDVREMRRLYEAGGISYRELSEKFGGTKQSVAMAVKGITWAHLSE